jgi:hypothetical protein
MGEDVRSRITKPLHYRCANPAEAAISTQAAEAWKERFDTLCGRRPQARAVAFAVAAQAAAFAQHKRPIRSVHLHGTGIGTMWGIQPINWQRPQADDEVKRARCDEDHTCGGAVHGRIAANGTGVAGKSAG